MAEVRFYSLLGVLDEEEAAAKWPRDRLQPVLGFLGSDEEFGGLMAYLQDTVTFRSARPGAGPDQVGLWAEVHVTNPVATTRVPLVMAQLPDIAFYLEDTAELPAYVFVTRGETGLEVVLQGLPVRMELPSGLLRPLPEPGQGGGSGELPDKKLTVDFDPNRPDSLEVTLSDAGASYVRVRVNARMTPSGDFVVDTVVPLSIGPCLFSGLPCKGLHDLQLIPSLVEDELPLEWKRHDLDLFGLDPSVPGMLAIRSVDFDMSREPLKRLAARIGAGREQGPVEFTIEDLVVPVYPLGPPLPLPAHGRFGLRRQVLLSPSSAAEPYDLTSAPVDLPVGPLLIRLFRLLLQTTDFEDEIPIAFDAVVQAEGAPESGWAFPVSVTDEGVVIAGARLPDDQRFRLFEALNVTVALAGVKIGLSVPRLAEVAREAVDWNDFWLVTVDLSLATPDKGKPVQVEPKTGKPEGATAPPPMLLHDVGWYLGHLSGGLYDPDGLDFVLLDRFRIRIEEFGLVTEDNGGYYLLVSGSIEVPFGKAAVGGAACAPSSVGTDEARAKGAGLHVHRLRSRLKNDDDQAPDFLLDGLSLFLTFSKVAISGFGMISEFDQPPGNHYREFAFGVRLCLEAIGKQFDLGLQILYGTVSGVDNFSYWLFALQLKVLPLGSQEISNLRVLLAGNMTPRLDPPDGNAQPMRLFRWYKDNGDAIELPLNRKLAAWGPEDQSFAAGIGAGLSFAGTKAVRFEVFLFLHSGPSEQGFLAGVELYALKAPKPLAFGAFEWDIARDKWGLALGFSLGLENLLGDTLPDWLSGLGAISGLLFFGNKPDTIAIGQYNDIATWPAFRLQFHRVLQLEAFIGFCRHTVDAATALDPDVEEVDVTGIIATVKGGGDLRVGKVRFYATISWVSGNWRNEGVATGDVIVIEAGLSIRLFGCFNFGASVKVDHAQLGPGDAEYHRTSTVVRIETPWYLPDLTLRWERTSGTPEPESMPVLSIPLVGASALPPGPRTPVTIGITTPGDLVDTALLDLRQLRSLASGPPANEAFDALIPVSVDSEIALDFKPSVEAVATVLPETADRAGTQQSNDLTVTYQLEEVGIRRRRRFGSAMWSNLIDPITTHLYPLPDLPTGEDLAALFQSPVVFGWDADVQRLGRVDPKRLLVNAVTPYTFLTANPEGDEVVAGSDPGWPCCHSEERRIRWHTVDFADIATGARAPVTDIFSDSASTFRWTSRPPTVGPAFHGPAGVPVARVPLGTWADGVLAIATFDDPAFVVEILAFWPAMHASAELVVEGYHGLEVVARSTLPISSANPPPPIRLEVARGMTSLLLRRTNGPPDGSFPPTFWFELQRIRYRTVRDELVWVADNARCEAGEGRIDGRGRLAWLPNTDYEISLRTRVELAYARGGTQEAVVEQHAYFRTKGLPGLNAVQRLGDEIEPYIESQYPGPDGYLYRLEPLVVAFGERFNTLVPADRTPLPGDPDERQQLLEWVLAVDKIGGGAGLERVSQTSPDWIVAHRPVPPPLPLRQAVVLTADVLATPVRTARSLDPYRQRFERMITRPGACDDPTVTQHPSQILRHEPYDPGYPDATTRRWERNQGYRVNVRLKGGPFVDRQSFDEHDAGAFAFRSDVGPPAAWVSDGGSMRVDSFPPGGGGQFAVFGDDGWDHVQIRVTLDPEGQQAGVAIAHTTFTGLEALIDERSGRQLRLVGRLAGTGIELASADLPEAAGPTYLLEVWAFDDRVRAAVGETTVEVDRAGARGGRLALVSRGRGRFTSLAVSTLDAYRFHFRSSRYDDFVAHIESFRGTVGTFAACDIAPTSASVGQLLVETSADIDSVMGADADAEVRQRLFERWVGALVLPVRQEPDALEITRFTSDGETDLLLVETPEPLAFSRDVSVRLERRMKPPRPLRERPMARPFPLALARAGTRTRSLQTYLPPEVTAWIEDLELSTERVLGPPLPVELRALHRVVHADQGDSRRTAYRIYERETGQKLWFEAPLFDIEAGMSPTLPEHAAIEPGQVGLFDRDGRLMIPPFSEPTRAQFVDIPVRILSDGLERVALVIPTAGPGDTHDPLPNGHYRLTFTIDRVRYRALMPDNASNYQATAIIPLLW